MTHMRAIKLTIFPWKVPWTKNTLPKPKNHGSAKWRQSSSKVKAYTMWSNLQFNAPCTGKFHVKKALWNIFIFVLFLLKNDDELNSQDRKNWGYKNNGIMVKIYSKGQQKTKPHQRRPFKIANCSKNRTHIAHCSRGWIKSNHIVNHIANYRIFLFFFKMIK